jgi:hypothetical protein
LPDSFEGQQPAYQAQQPAYSQVQPPAYQVQQPTFVPASTPSAKPKSKVGRVIGIAACVVALLGIAAVGALTLPNLLQNPTKQLTKASDKTEAVVTAKQAKIASALHTSAFADLEDPLSVSLTADLTETLSDIGLSTGGRPIEVSLDMEPISGGGWQYTIGNSLDLEAKLAMKGTKFAISVPQLLDKAVSLDLITFRADLNSTPYGSSIPLDPEVWAQYDEAIRTYNDIIAGTKINQSSENIADQLLLIQELFNGFGTGKIVEKPVEATLDSGEKGKSFLTTYPNKEIETLQEDVLDALEDICNELFSSVSSISGGVLDDYGLERELNEIKTTYKAAFREFRSLEISELETVDYIDSKGFLRDKSIEFRLEDSYGEKHKVRLFFASGDADFNDWKLEVTLDKTKIKVAGKTEFTDEAGLNTSLSITLPNDNGKLSTAVKWNPNKSKNNLSVTAEVDETSISFVGNLVVTDTKQTFTFLSFSYNDRYDDVSFNGDISISYEKKAPLTSSILDSAVGFQTLKESDLEIITQRAEDIYYSTLEPFIEDNFGRKSSPYPYY